MKPSTITREQWLKVAKTFLYVAVSAMIGEALALLTDKPEAFGVYTPLVNLALVTLKQLFTKPEVK